MARSWAIFLAVGMLIPLYEEATGREKTPWLTNSECTVVGDPRARKGGALRLHLDGFPKALRAEGPYTRDPVLMKIHGLVYESLLLLDPETLDYVPCLASHWRFSKDRETFWLRLDSRARWADGKPVTVRDVMATWNYLQNTHLGEAVMDRKYAGSFREVTAEDTHTLKIRLWARNWRRFHFFTSLPVFPADFILNRGDMYAEEYYAKIPQGTGPYALLEKNIRWGRSMALVRRKDYWASGERRNVGRFNFDRIEWAVFKGRGAALQRFLGGALDAYVAENPRDWVAGCKAEAVEKGWVQRRRVYTEKPAVYTAFVFNMRRPPFMDLRVRKAFAHLLDREKICKVHFHGLVKPASSFYPGRHWSRPTAADVRYDPGKARSLLKGAGYHFRAQDGWFYDGKGSRLSTVLLYADKALRDILQDVALTFESAGVKCTLRQVNRQMLLGGIVRNEFALHFMRWETSVLPDPGATWSSGRSKGRVGNIAGLEDKRVDELCAAYYKTEDRKEHFKILGRVDAQVARHHPFALGWYSDHTRIFFWDKFRHPATVLTRLGGAEDILSTWWLDSEKERALTKAKHEKKILANGETVCDPWKRR